MMSEPMTIWVEVWPVAADELGIWALAPDAWRDGPVMADSSVHFMVESVLREHGINPGDQEDPDDRGDLLMLHSTSWRPGGPRQYNVYVVAVNPGGLVVERWPDAKPVTPDLYAKDECGKPRPHGPTEEPAPRYLDVLIHGIGHFKDQMERNSVHRAALGQVWADALVPFEATLGGLYESTADQAA